MKLLAACFALILIAVGILTTSSSQELAPDRSVSRRDPPVAPTQAEVVAKFLDPIEIADFDPEIQENESRRTPALTLVIRLVLVSNAPGDDLRLAAPRVAWSSDGRDWHESDHATEFTGSSADFGIPWSGDSVTINCGATGFHSELRSVEERPESGIIEVELHPCGVIRGQVLLHGSGAVGMEGATVVAWPEECKASPAVFQIVVDGTAPMTPTARTAAKGHFEITGIRRDGTYRVVPFTKGFVANRVATHTVGADSAPLEFSMKELYAFYPRFVSLAADGSRVEIHPMRVQAQLGKLPDNISMVEDRPETISHLSLGLGSWDEIEANRPARPRLFTANATLPDKVFAVTMGTRISRILNTVITAKPYSLAVYPLQMEDIILASDLRLGRLEFTIIAAGTTSEGRFALPQGLVSVLLMNTDPKAGGGLLALPTYNKDTSMVVEAVPPGTYRVQVRAGHALGPTLPERDEPKLEIRVEPNATSSFVVENDEVAAIKWSWPARTAEEVQIRVVPLEGDKPLSTGTLSFSASQGLIPLITPGKYHVKLLARGDASAAYRQRAEQMIELRPGEVQSIIFNP